MRRYRGGETPLPTEHKGGEPGEIGLVNEARISSSEEHRENCEQEGLPHVHLHPDHIAASETVTAIQIKAHFYRSVSQA